MDEKRNIHKGMPLKIRILKNYKNDRINTNIVRKNKEKKLLFLFGPDINLNFSKVSFDYPIQTHPQFIVSL